LRDCDGKVYNELTIVKSALRRNRQKLGIKSVWLGRKCGPHVATDHIHNARLRVAEDYDLVLAVRFETSQDLTSYYADEDHAEFRRKLYRRLDSAVDLIFALMEISGLPAEKKTAFFEDVIEPLVARHLVRYDFVEQEDIDSIVEEDPVQFDFKYSG
jgi:hypothetical protein